MLEMILMSFPIPAEDHTTVSYTEEDTVDWGLGCCKDLDLSFFKPFIFFLHRR